MDEVRGEESGRNLCIAATPWRRAHGLLGVEGFEDVLMLVPCRDIHTVGMTQHLDVAFCDESGQVLLARRNIPPGRRLRHKKACAVLERISSLEPWYEEGERVAIAGGRAGEWLPRNRQE